MVKFYAEHIPYRAVHAWLMTSKQTVPDLKPKVQSRHENKPIHIWQYRETMKCI